MKSIINKSQHAILMTFDKKYLDYGVTCLHSIAVNYPNHPDVFVSYEGDDLEDIERIFSFDRVYPIDFSDSDDRIDGLDYGLVGSKQVYMRFYAWSSVFEAYDKVMYLDADCLVLNPLEHMFGHEDFYIIKDLMTKAADCWVFKLEYEMDSELNKKLEIDGLRYSDMQYRMCNAGVFVVSKQYRTKKHWERLWQIARNYNTYLKLGDQSVISIWCAIQGIDAKKNFEDNLQTAGLFYFNLDLPIADLKTYPSAKETLKIFHFSYLKPQTEVLERYRANFTLYYESFKKYQYYLNLLPTTRSRIGKLDIQDLSMVWIIQSDDEKDHLTERKFLLTYLEKTYSDYEIIVVEYGKQAIFKQELASRKNLRYYHMSSDKMLSKPALINFSIHLAKRQKVLIFNGLYVPHPKALLKASMLIEEEYGFVTPHDNKLHQIDFIEYKKKRGKLDFFPERNSAVSNWSHYALENPKSTGILKIEGFCFLIDRIQLNLNLLGVFDIDSEHILEAVTDIKHRFEEKSIKIIELPYSLYSFGKSNQK